MKSLTTYINEKLIINKHINNKHKETIYIKRLEDFTNTIENIISQSNTTLLDLSNISFEYYEDDVLLLESKFNNLLFNMKVHTKYEKIDVSNWCFSEKIHNISGIFRDCRSVKEIIGLDTWDVSNITSMRSFFSGCSNITDMSGIENWNVSSVQQMSAFFAGCMSLKRLDLSKWDVSNAQYVSVLFKKCLNLEEIKGLDKWNTENFGSCGMMFQSCTKLKTLDLSNWIMDKVISTNEMFDECRELTSIGDISNWNTEHIQTMEKMFYNCENLSCDCRQWNIHPRCTLTKVATYTNRRIFYSPQRKNIKI